jgi:anti-sigma factor RsiW
MSAHLGLAVTAFVDGELDHGRRDEVLAHLTHCLSCRAEVDALRRLKETLRAEAPAVPGDLAARLLASGFSAGPPAPVAAPRGPHLRRRSSRHSRLRRTAMRGALVALGLGGALSLAGPPPRGPVAPVDPTNAGFIRDHTATSNELPFTEMDAVPVLEVASVTPSPRPRAR